MLTTGLLVVLNIVWGYLWWRREKRHEDFVKWIFLDWAWRFKTGEFDAPEKPKGPDIENLRRTFLQQTRRSVLFAKSTHNLLFWVNFPLG